MKKPDLKDFRLKAIKVLTNGGADVEWSYMYSTGNDADTDEMKARRTLNVHDDLFGILKDQKPNVMAVEEINYRTMATTLQQMGANNEDQVSQVVEGMTIDAMSKIEITGIRLSGRENKRNAVITYKKILGNKKIAGRATTAILLSGNLFGFEEQLESDIEDLTAEVYRYLYGNKHSDEEQGQLFPDIGNKVGEDSEENPED